MVMADREDLEAMVTALSAEFPNWGVWQVHNAWYARRLGNYRLPHSAYGQGLRYAVKAPDLERLRDLLLDQREIEADLDE